MKTVSMGSQRNRAWRILALTLLLVPLSSAALALPATAEVPAQGSATLVLGSGKAGKALSKARVRISSANADAPVPIAAGKVQLGFPVKDVTVSETGSVVDLVGSLVFAKRSKKVTVGRLSLVSGSDSTVIKGRLGGSVTTVFRAGGAATLNAQVGTVAIAGRTTILTPGSARTLARKLRIAKLPAAAIGTASTSGIQAAFEDPYGDTCSLPATSKVAGTLPGAEPAPDFEGTTPAEGLDVSWGFRSGFRNYLNFLPGGQGVMLSFDRASVIPNPVPPFTPTGFKWGFESGRFDPGSTGAATDRAVLEGSGTILLCHKTQFRVNLSNPEIVLDGLRARLIFDVDTNVLGEWIPTQRITLANLITSEATRSQDATSTTWSNVPVVLTEAGSDALRLAPFSPTFRYQAGQALEPISFTVTSASPA